MNRLGKARGVLRQGLLALVGVAVGAAAIYVLNARRGPDLEVWHTVELSEEFRRGSQAEVSTLTDYLELEDRLFAELDAEVYDRTESGPATRLSRYSSGGLPDPRFRAPNWNRTFVFDADSAVGGVLLLHGMSDSPYSLRALGESLNDRGYHVVGLRLPGHGTAPSGLKAVRWQDMAEAVELGMSHLAEAIPGKPLHMVGYSTGAALAVHHTLEALEGGVEGPPPRSLVLISPALGVTPLAVLAKWTARLSKLPGLEKLAWQSTLPEFDPYKYGSFAINAADQVFRLTQSVSEHVQQRARTRAMDDFPPVLALVSAADATVPAGAVVDRLLAHLSPGQNELVVYDVNRTNAISTVLVSNPAQLVNRLAQAPGPFTLTVVTNESPESSGLVVRRRTASAPETATPLDITWPRGVFSLSHVALPFPPDDALYGQTPPQEPDVLYLGTLPAQGERGVLAFPASWLLRLRHNPFWDHLEDRALTWIATEGRLPPDEPVGPDES